MQLVSAVILLLHWTGKSLRLQCLLLTAGPGAGSTGATATTETAVRDQVYKSSLTIRTYSVENMRVAVVVRLQYVFNTDVVLREENQTNYSKLK